MRCRSRPQFKKTPVQTFAVRGRQRQIVHGVIALTRCVRRLRHAQPIEIPQQKQQHCRHQDDKRPVIADRQPATARRQKGSRIQQQPAGIGTGDQTPAFFRRRARPTGSKQAI